MVFIKFIMVNYIYKYFFIFIIIFTMKRKIQEIDNIINDVMGYGLTYKQQFNKKFKFDKNQSHTLDEISKLSKYKKRGLETIYRKGVGAYHTNHESVRPQVHSPEQWAMARVYASINPKSKASKVDKKHLIGGKINFHKIHWGAFTKQFNNRKNKRLKNFKEFSEYILKHPDEFNKITKKRANFYKNFIFGGMIGCGDRSMDFNPDAPLRPSELPDQRYNIPFEYVEDTPFEALNSENNSLISHDSFNSIPEIQSSSNTKISNIINPKEIKKLENNIVPSITELTNQDEKVSESVEEAKKTDLTTKVGKYKYLIDIQEERKKHYKQKINEMNVILISSNSMYFRNGIEFIDVQKKIRKLTTIILTEGMLELSNDCRNKKLAFIYFRIIRPSMPVKEILKDIWAKGKGLEYALSGRNNPISNLLFGLSSNNFQVVDFTVEQMFHYVKAKLLKIFDAKELPSGASAGSAPIDLYDDENNILNEVKDFWDKDFESLYNHNIEEMQELYINLKYRRDDGETDIDGFKIIELIKDSDKFKLWYYKNYNYYGFSVQLAKLPPTDHSLTKDELNKFSDDSYINYIYGGDFKQIFNSNFEVIRWESIKGYNSSSGPIKGQQFYNRMMNKYLKAYLKGNNVFYLTINTNNIVAKINMSELLKKYNGQLGTIFRCDKKKIIIPWTEFTICGSAKKNKVEQTVDKWINRWQTYAIEKEKHRPDEVITKDIIEHSKKIIQKRIDKETRMSEIENELLKLEKEKEERIKNKKPIKAIDKRILNLEDEIGEILSTKDLIKTYGNTPNKIL